MGIAAQASLADHSHGEPQRFEHDGSPTWITRGSNFVVAITRASSKLRLASSGVPDEHMVLLPEIGATIHAGGGHGATMATAAGGCHLAIVPPGDSEIRTLGEGLIVRCFSRRHGPMLARAGNGSDFELPNPDVAPLEDWPAPIRGFSLRLYDLRDEHQAGDKNRCYRSSNMMINVLRERREPRAPSDLSPHAHADFEQGSIALKGRYIHHLRAPWGPDATKWRPDQALEVGSPSVTVIAPNVIHTSRNVGAGAALLADLFCPPRLDFSVRPGMVRNAGEYPPGAPPPLGL